MGKTSSTNSAAPSAIRRPVAQYTGAYYDVPLVFSLAGGIVAMALTLAFLLAIRSESLFYG